MTVHEMKVIQEPRREVDFQAEIPFWFCKKLEPEKQEVRKREDRKSQKN